MHMLHIYSTYSNHEVTKTMAATELFIFYFAKLPLTRVRGGRRLHPPNTYNHLPTPFSKCYWNRKKLLESNCWRLNPLLPPLCRYVAILRRDFKNWTLCVFTWQLIETLLGMVALCYGMLIQIQMLNNMYFCVCLNMFILDKKFLPAAVHIHNTHTSICTYLSNPQIANPQILGFIPQLQVRKLRKCTSLQIFSLDPQFAKPKCF